MTVNTCLNCKWRMDGLTCAAFTKGIPKEILKGEIAHDKVMDGQDLPVTYEEYGKA